MFPIPLNICQYPTLSGNVESLTNADCSAIRTTIYSFHNSTLSVKKPCLVFYHKLKKKLQYNTEFEVKFGSFLKRSFFTVAVKSMLAVGY